MAIVGEIMLKGGKGINGEQGRFYSTCYTERLKIDHISRLIFCIFLTVIESNKRLKDT